MVQYSFGVDVTSRDGRMEDNEDKEELGAECGSFYSKKNSRSRERKTKSTSTGATNCDEDDYGISRRRGGKREEGGGGRGNVTSIWRRSDVPAVGREKKRVHEVGRRPTRVVSIYTKLFNH